VTGSTEGIGKAIAHSLAQEGGNVAICSRNQARVNSTIAEFSGYSGKVMGAAVDLTDEAGFAKWVGSVAAASGGIDIFVANVTGLMSPHGLSSWESAVKTDILATVSSISAALPSLKTSKHGVIIYISSMAGIIATPHVPAYGAAKAAMIRYMKTLSKTLVKDGVRVNTVSPGDIITKGNIWDRVRINNPRMYEEVLARNPRGNLGTPEEVARVVSFIASPLASLVNGAHLVVDGCSTDHVHF
ncbi:MAG TPA: SDR family oxidoreductase, partial [Cellvibrionaceae bacterium]